MIQQEDRIEKALELARVVRDWAVQAYEWQCFWDEMGWRPKSAFEKNGKMLRDFIAQAESDFPELKEDE